MKKRKAHHIRIRPLTAAEEEHLLKSKEEALVVHCVKDMFKIKKPHKQRSDSSPWWEGGW